MKNIHLIVVAFVVVFCGMTAQAQKKKASEWYRGNTHTHTRFSDGDTSVDQVVEWYNSQPYHFLLISDHNKTSYPPAVAAEKYRKDLILVPANEITDRVHYTALNIKEPLTAKEILNDYKTSGKYGEGVIDSAQTNTGYITLISNAVTAHGAICFVNHPNFSKGVQPEEICGNNKVTHIELFNGHPGCYNWGKEGHTSVDEKWDYILSQGKLVYGVASDDAHNFKVNIREKACPGRGWIMVNAARLTSEDVTKAIADGQFYASSGVHLADCVVENNRLSVKVDAKKTMEEIHKGFVFENRDTKGKEGFLIEVIGQNGSILKSSDKKSLSYSLKPTDAYARIRITYCEKSGNMYKKYYAWTQPVMR